MTEILIDGYKFFEMQKDPNIYISLNGKKNFCNLSQEDKASFLNKHLGIESYHDFKQVHGNNIYGLDENMDSYDGFYTNRKNHAFAIKTADCIPLIMWDDEKNFLCGLHCGWRGLSNDIIKKALMHENCNVLQNAFIGPHISSDHFEIKSDLIRHFHSVGKDINKFLSTADDQIFLNLRKVCEAQLTDLGIQNFNKYSPCSYREKTNFFSYRRDKEKALRNLTIAWF